MRTFDDMLSKQLKDDEFRKEYEAIQPEMDVIRAIVDARTSQNMTQKALYQLMSKLNEAEISIHEEGTISADDLEKELCRNGQEQVK